MIVGGIYGPKKSGKTELAKHLGRDYWTKENRRSLVLDPNGTDSWGNEFWVTANNEEFWGVAWSTTNCLLIVDDAGKTIDRDKDVNDAFTRINHNGHKLLIVGHSGTNLNPLQRQQMDTVYLFRNTVESGEQWRDVFCDDKIRCISKLQRYEFLYVRQFEKTERMRLTLG